MGLNNLLTSIIHRAAERIKLVQTSTTALKYAKHNRNQCEVLMARSNFKSPRFLKYRIQVGCNKSFIILLSACI